AEKYNIEQNNENYNLIINDTRYNVSTEKTFDWDFMKQLVDIEDLNLILVSDKNDKRLSEDKENIFVTIDYAKQKALPLMSLGNNVEQLVESYAVSHLDWARNMTQRVLAMTANIANSREEFVSVIRDNPVLMAQILLGIYSEETYDPLSEESPFLTQEDVTFLKTELEIKLSVDGARIVVSKGLDFVVNEDSYSFATLDVSDGTAKLFISEAFLKHLDELPSQEKRYFLEQLVTHEVGEYNALKQAQQENKVLNYADYHKQIEHDTDQKALMEEARLASAKVFDKKKKIALQKLVSFVSEFNAENILPNDIAGNLNLYAQVISDGLANKKESLDEISLDVLESAMFLLTLISSEEKSNILSAFKGLDEWEVALGNIVDKNSNRFMLISDFMTYIYSDTEIQRPKTIAFEEAVLEESAKEALSLNEQTSRMHRLMASA
ncbi:MAG: hypothetical protein II816_04680, partial [Elusimicrobia bacterium]|nr:hypothetical protein [Elusimicrobiota bacterium]